MRRNKGFTLVELMVSIAIIVVLSLIVMAVLNSSRNKSNDSKVISQLKSMIPQAQLFNGPTTLIGWSRQAVDDLVSGGGHSTVGLFWNPDASSNSLYRLALYLPTGTVIYYGTENKLPSLGGKWVFAASTSTGAYCVDYNGAGKAINTGSPMTAGGANGTAALYPNIANQSFSCN